MEEILIEANIITEELEHQLEILKENEYRAFIEEEHAKQHSL